VHLLLQVKGFRMRAFRACIGCRRLLLMRQQGSIAPGIGTAASGAGRESRSYQLARSWSRKRGYRRSVKSFFALIGRDC
jgi:hypothetical protein